MKNLITSVLFVLVMISLFSCKSTLHTNSYVETKAFVEDTTYVDPYQEAFAVFLGTLSEKERQEVLNGMVYTEEEKNSFLNEVEIKTKN